jgi:MFS family permease
MGRVSDKIGRRLPIVMGCVIAAAPLFVIPFVTDLAVLIVLAILYGFGFATVTASTSPLISELVPMELVGASMGFLATTMDAGQTIGPIVSGFMLATSLQYFGVFPALAIVVLFSSVVFYLSGISKTSSSDAKLT